MNELTWQLIPSDIFKHQYYYSSNGEISWIPKEDVNRLVSVIKQYELRTRYDDLVLVDSFQTVAAASRKTEVDSSDISRVCKGVNKTAGKFIWKYEENGTIGQYSYTKHTDRIWLRDFRSFEDASRATGIYSTNISGACRGIGKSAGGFYWDFGEGRVEKTQEERDLELQKNTLKGHVDKEYGDLLYNVVGANGKSKSVKNYRLIYYVNNYADTSGCKNCSAMPGVFNPLSTNLDVDHIDGNHDNHEPGNLQLLCRPCHASKTKVQTKENRRSVGLKLSIKLVAFKEGDGDYRESFRNAKEASEKLEVAKISVSWSAREFIRAGKIVWIGSSVHCNKYRFEPVHETIENEMWAKVPGMNLEASNLGRVKFRTGRITIGTSVGSYLCVQQNKKSYRVHILVLKAFKYDELVAKATQQKSLHPECVDITVETILDSVNMPYSIDVDHISRDTSDNSLLNLRWVSKKENCANRENARLVEQWSYDKKTLIRTFASQTEAAKETGTNLCSINAVCTQKIPKGRDKPRASAGGFFWKYAG